ncbi:MAG: PAS domain-containing sensor histidine kinase [Myxococcota bacterium]|nr:PAS domain-containing sensor histidine kinase [Myxococcota bacterium]
MLVSETDDAIFTKDLQGRYLTINRAGAAMIGRPAEEIPGRTDFELLAADDAISANDSDRRALQSGGLIHYEDHRSDRVWLSTKGVLHDDAGEAFGVFGIARDVTDTWRAQAIERLLIGIVAHDLRSPLAALTMNAACLNVAELPRTVRRAASRITSSISQMNELVGSILDVVRVRAGVPLPMAPTRVDLYEVCLRAADQNAQNFPGQQMEISCEGNCEGYWDENRLLQALGNLIINAMKYGGAEAPVKITCRRGENEVTVEVKNQGPPISQELLPHIFEPFRRGTSKHADGAGLGLFIVREVARAHQGKVEVASSSTQGTTFALTLPVGESRPDRPGTVESRRASVAL